jgi:hypothetical protein
MLERDESSYHGIEKNKEEEWVGEKKVDWVGK